MKNKIVRTITDALAGIGHGASVMIGGFGSVGQPDILIEGLVELGLRDLIVISNNTGAGERGLGRLLAEGRVRRVICSFPRVPGSTVFEELYKNGRIELELLPQGTLAERIRAGGAGIGAFFTPTSHGTDLAAGKEVRQIGGRSQVLEYALNADVALIRAWRTDRLGNCVYRGSGRNFNPVMATAAALTIVETVQVAEVGDIDPEHVVTPGIFVDRVFHASKVCA